MIWGHLGAASQGEALPASGVWGRVVPFPRGQPRPGPAHPSHIPRAAGGSPPASPGPPSAGAEGPSSARDSPGRAHRGLRAVGGDVCGRGRLSPVRVRGRAASCPFARPAREALGAPLPGCGGVGVVVGWARSSCVTVEKKNNQICKLKITTAPRNGFKCLRLSARRLGELRGIRGAPASRLGCGGLSPVGCGGGGAGRRGGSAGGPDPQHRQQGGWW